MEGQTASQSTETEQPLTMEELEVLRQKVLAGEEVSVELQRRAIMTLRQDRATGKPKGKKVKGAPASNAEVSALFE